MNWNRGFSAAYYIKEVDPVTWEDTDRIEITGGSITITNSNLRNSATLDCINFDQSREKWVRVYLAGKQGQNSELVPLFTGLASSPNRKINGKLVSNQVSCYSVLKPCEDVLLPRGWYAPTQVPGTTILMELLEVTAAPVETESVGPMLTEPIIAEQKETHLSMIDRILEAMNWRLVIQGDGTIYIGGKATEESYIYDPIENDAIEPQIDITYDWYSCPNVFRATSGDSSAVVKDEESDTRLSIKNRGREVWDEDTSCQFKEGETLTDYARRRLKEVQHVQLVAKYTRRYNPAVNVTDLVRLHYPEQGLSGVFLVRSQSLKLGDGIKVSEEVITYE